MISLDVSPGKGSGAYSALFKPTIGPKMTSFWFPGDRESHVGCCCNL
jgi:hypothetical protein